MRIRCVHFGSGWVGRRTLSAEELARDVELLAADNNNLLTVQKLLGDSGGQATEEVALSVDNYLFRALLAMLQESSIRVSSSTAPKPLHPCVLQVGRVRAKVFRGRGCVPQARKCSYLRYWVSRRSRLRRGFRHSILLVVEYLGFLKCEAVLANFLARAASCRCSSGTPSFETNTATGTTSTGG